MTSENLVKIREQEQRNAGNVLGLQDVVFLEYEDSMLEPSLELRRDITRQIRRYKPDVVICETPMRSAPPTNCGRRAQRAAGERRWVARDRSRAGSHKTHCTMYFFQARYSRTALSFVLTAG